MAVDGRLNFDTKIDTGGFDKGTKNISGRIGNLRTEFKKLASAAAGAFAVKKLIDFGRQSVETASDLAEVQNVVDTAFGSMSSKMEEFADTSIQQFGISRLEAKRTGSTFMAMASGMGLAQDSASDMAVALTGLSADMASFYNVEQDVASTALKSIFTGETETLKQFGIVMTDTNLQAYALSQGISKSTSEMSQAEKVQLRYNYVMSQTTLAQGDFAKTSDSWANQTRILSEQWKEFGSVIGTVLMNVLLPAVRTINDVLSRLIALAQSAAQALSEAFGFELNNAADDAQDIAKSTSQAADNYSDIADNAEKADEAQENSLASFDQINKLEDSKNSSSASAADIGTAIGSLNGTTVSAAVDIDTSPADKTLTDFFKRVKKSFNTIFDPFKQAWNKKGSKVAGSIQYKFSSIYGLISAIGSSFAKVWTNGTGEKTVGHILDIFTNINTTIGNIANNLKTTWTTDNIGTDIVQHAADIWDTILTHVSNITKKISDWSAKVDFEPLFSSFDTLETALQPFADTIGAGLEDFFDEVLLPLAGWTIEDLIPTFLETLADVIAGLTATWNTAYPVIKEKLWDEFLEPIAKWAADAAVKAIKGLGKYVKKLGESITEDEVNVLLDLAGAIAAVVAAVKLKKMVDEFSTSLSGMATTVKTTWAKITATTTAEAGAAGAAAGTSFSTKFFAGLAALFVGWEIGSMIRDAIGGDKIDEFLFPIFDKIVAFFTDFADSWSVGWETIKSGWSDFWDSVYIGWDTIASFFTETIPSFFSGLWEDIKSVFSSVGDFFSEKYNDITGAFSDIGTWFGEKFSTAWSAIKKPFISIGEWFRNRWQDIKDVFKAVKAFFSAKFTSAWNAVKKPFEAVGEFFGGVWDGMTSGLKAAINTVIDGLNWMIGGLNSISFDMPDWDWLPDSIQGSSFGINIPEIPKLAQGAVIPPNSEFLAVLGDQKRGTNVEAPLDTITQAVMQALVAYGGAGGNGNQKVSVTIPVTLNGRVITQIVIDNINDLIKCNGKSPIIA